MSVLCHVRIIVQRDGDAVRVTTRRGYDWSRPLPRIIDQAHQAPLPFKPAARSDTRKRSASVGSL
jgi:hypothetical protein